jgi:periplasmic divalent cation tolerance protein
VTVAPAVVVVLATAPSRDVAADLVNSVVEERLAACGNIVPDILSIYRWEGAVERQEEVLIIFKTERAAVPRLLARIADLHPYDVPEALAFDVVAGLPPYLTWVAANADG